MDWIARLGGDDWSLQALSEALPTEPRVWKDEDGQYYLSSAALSACLGEGGAWSEAERTVARINEAAAALEPGHRPVVTQAVVRVDDDGSRRAFAYASVGLDAAVARARAVAMVVRADGTVETPGPSRLALLYLKLEREGGQSDLAKALQAWRSAPRDWALLYHVYEIIKHDVSDGSNDYRALQEVIPRGMTWPELDAELERFRETGADPALVGPAARHGKPKAKSISNPMPLREADDLIRRLLDAWIQTKGC